MQSGNDKLSLFVLFCKLNKGSLEAGGRDLLSF